MIFVSLKCLLVSFCLTRYFPFFFFLHLSQGSSGIGVLRMLFLCANGGHWENNISTENKKVPVGIHCNLLLFNRIYVHGIITFVFT